MHDPLEGVTSRGTIATGVSRDRVPARFEPVLDAAVAAVPVADREASLYLYGSVATGTAQAGRSDVDLLTVGLPSSDAADITRDLSFQFSGICRAVQIAAAQLSDFSGETDAAYGGRVFLRHYCVHLAGPDLHSELPEFLANIRAARGFNGDIAQHAQRWRRELEEGCDPVQLSQRMARKSLFAVTGLVSVHDATWTTDRTAAAARWAEIRPDLAGDLRMLLTWASGSETPDRYPFEAALDGVVAQIVTSFEATIGLWNYGNGH